MDFLIPYTFGVQERPYLPDFIAKLDDGHGSDDLMNLVIEASGEKHGDKYAEVAAFQSLWVPAVNNSNRFGRCAFIQITDRH